MDDVDRISSFRPVGWYWNGELHLFEGESMPNGIEHEYEEQDAQPASHASEDEKDSLLYWAWTIIANAGEGDWTREFPAWQKAATEWRDRWHATLHP